MLSPCHRYIESPRHSLTLGETMKAMGFALELQDFSLCFCAPWHIGHVIPIPTAFVLLLLSH